MKFRRLQITDLDAVAGLETAVQVHPWTPAQIREVGDLLAHHYSAWVATGEEQICGYLIVQRVVDAFEILTIGVSQADQGRGVGFALWQYAWADLRVTYPEIHTCFLEVRESNQAARALYARCGFEPVGRRRHYYQNPSEDALILQKNDDHSNLS